MKLPLDTPLPFFGVDGNCFKIGDKVLEAVEDENDGYRSMLEDVRERTEEGLVFFGQPLDTVMVREAPPEPTEYSRDFRGHEVVSTKDGHRWLLLGTDDFLDYYPMFTFAYSPRVAPMETA